MGRQKTTGRVVKSKGVGFEPGVLEYLEYITSKEGCSRSAFLNQLAKADAANRGLDMSQFKATAQPQNA